MVDNATASQRSRMEMFRFVLEWWNNNIYSMKKALTIPNRKKTNGCEY